jgi:signal peptidase I
MRAEWILKRIWFLPALGLIPEIVQVIPIKGRSMAPIVNPNIDKERDVLLTKITKNPKVGDIVVFRSISNPELMMCKRVIGLEGDFGTDRNGNTVQIPIGRMWVEGSGNRSLDSRDFGPVPKGLLVGTGIGIVWPFSRIQFL